MKTVLKYTAGALLAASSVASANAATKVFNLTGTDNSATLGVAGNERISTEGFLTVRATAWNSDGSNVFSSYLGAFSKGYGVGDGGVDQHFADNKGTFDFIVLQFSHAVTLESGLFNPFYVAPTGFDTDASFAFGTNGGGYMNNLFADGDSLASIAPLFDGYFHSDVNAVAPALRAINPGAFSGNTWVIAARAPIDGADQKFDGFKLQQLTVSAVPEASTWAMMIFGFGAVGAAMRGRRKVAKVGYAF